MTDLLSLPFDALDAWLRAQGISGAHTSGVFRALHRTHTPPEAVAGLGRAAAHVLAQAGRAPVAIRRAHRGADGNERLVFELHDGAQVEGVLLPQAGSDRTTLCLSSQVGCAMACAFCATGTLGLRRQLTAGEIVGQVYAARQALAAGGRRLTHLVFMGMGEPLHNYDALRDALSILFDPHGAPIARRHVTVSTVGLVRRIAQLGQDFGGRLQLALSLHAGTDATRRRLLPTARATDLAALKQAVQAYPLPGSRHLMIEYVVLPGVNDHPDELDGLAAWMDGVDGIVNLIPFNPFVGAAFRPPTRDEIGAVAGGLRRRGVLCRVRWPRGREAHGACGQLMLAGGGEAERCL